MYYYEYNKNWRLWTTLSNKNVSINIFWYVKVYVFWKFIQYTTHWDKTQKTSQKMHSFFFRELVTVFSFSFSLFFFTYASWSTRFISLELCVGFSIPSFLSVLSKLIFLFKKNMDCLPLKLIIPFKIKTIEKPHSFDPRPSSQIFKLHQGVLKIQWYCVSWSFPKTCLESNFSNLNRSFEYATFSHVTDMKSHPGMKLVLWWKKSVYTWIPFERKPLVEY